MHLLFQRLKSTHIISNHSKDTQYTCARRDGLVVRLSTADMGAGDRTLGKTWKKTMKNASYQNGYNFRTAWATTSGLGSFWSSCRALSNGTKHDRFWATRKNSKAIESRKYLSIKSEGDFKLHPRNLYIVYNRAKAHTPPRQLRGYRGLSKEIKKKTKRTSALKKSRELPSYKRRCAWECGIGSRKCAHEVEKPTRLRKAKNSMGIRVPRRDEWPC